MVLYHCFFVEKGIKLVETKTQQRHRHQKIELQKFIFMTIEELKNEIDEIKERNKRVDLDKAWETSWTRRLLILVLTYFVVVIFFFVAKLPDPFVSSLVPTLGFFLSTLTIPWVKT